MNTFTDKYTVGDNLENLKLIETETVDLIYTDPPYNTGRNFGDYTDKYESMKVYSDYMKLRIVELHRILSKTGTLVIHIEPRVSHYFRIICDEIFGMNKFRNEIVWKTGGNAKNLKKLNRFHDTIIVYTKTNKYTFNPIYFPYDAEYRSKTNIKMCEFNKMEYITTAIHNSQAHVNPRPNLVYEWKGITKQWYASKERMEKLENGNRLEYNKSGVPRIKRFLKEMDGIPLRDIWMDISNTQSNEKLNYATQKPIKLLERILTLYSNEGDVCLDCFAGSGVLGRACIKNNRRYILLDVNIDGKNIFEESIIGLDLLFI
jgi:site-specific DNA-methyltransferase (adenine-specific)